MSEEQVSQTWTTSGEIVPQNQGLDANFGFGALLAFDDESNYGPGTEGTPACNCGRPCGTLRAGELTADKHRTAEVLAAGRLRMGRDQAMQCPFYTGTCSPAAPFFHAPTETISPLDR